MAAVGRSVAVVDAQDPVHDLMPRLADALDAGPALAALHAGPARKAGRLDEPVDDGVALLLPTSGSTGAPKVVELTASALRSSARSTHDRLGGPGTWLLALPLTHVAGWQVLVRSHVVGLEPGVLGLADGFQPGAFADAVRALDGPRRYTSLVPTQLARLLDDDAGRVAVASLDGVLLGGAAASSTLLARARAAGARVVTTYGMTETCGGCVYDGVPLKGVRARLDDEGRVLLAGPVLARGYRSGAGERFVTEDGERWFVTADAGRWRADGSLEVLGRLDDVLVTGGEKVAPAAVEDALTGRAGVAECVVVGVPDADWGQVVTAVVVAEPGAAPTTHQVRELLRPLLPAAALPRHVVVVGALPLRGPGKADRVAAADLARRAVTDGG